LPRRNASTTGSVILPLAEVVADILAELGGLAAVIQHIVDQLERDAEIHADRAARGLLGLRTIGNHRADLAGRRETARRSCRGSRRDIRPRWVAVFFAAASCITSPSAMVAAADERMSRRAQRADFDHHAKGLAEQEVADQYARLVAPQHARGQLAAPQFAFVDHVVMQAMWRCA